MMDFIKGNYKKLVVAGMLTSAIFLLGELSGGFIIRPGAVIQPLYIVINIFAFLLCWLALTLLISKFPIYKVLGVLGLLFLGGVAEYFMDVPNNPISIPLLILFWMGVSYLLVPTFFKKYRIGILFIYGAIIAYFFMFRGKPDYDEIHRPIITNFLIITVSLMIILWAYGRWKWLATLREDKARAELTLLKNQINPHFFFNTLNNLYGLAVEKSDQTPEMILKLSDMMRYTIYDGMADVVPLQDEISYLEDYIALQKIRYQKKVEITFEKELPYTQNIAPILLVVPLENAFKHGVESLMENAFIKIEVRTTASKVHFQMSNNYESKIAENKGIGLDNLRKRLEMIYPDKHTLEIKDTGTIYELYLSIKTA